MKNPSLRYSQLTEGWQATNLLTSFYEPEIKITPHHIYYVGEDKILRMYDNFGNTEEIAITEHNIYLDTENNLAYIQNQNLHYLNKEHHISCDDSFIIIQDHLYFVNQFMTSHMIIKYALNQETEICRSQLMQSIKKLITSQNQIIAVGEHEIVIFDKDLNIIKKMDANFITEASIYDDLILVLTTEVNKSRISLYNINGKTLWLHEYSGQINNFKLSEKSIFISTENDLYCFNRSSYDEIWKKSHYEYFACFNDETEHFLATTGKNIDIYEVATGILVWKDKIDYPVCGKPHISNDRFVIPSYKNGGLHYFGEQNQWQLDF